MCMVKGLSASVIMVVHISISGLKILYTQWKRKGKGLGFAAYFWI